MSALIRVEIYPAGLTRVFVAPPRDAAAAARLWHLYEKLRPHIRALETVAQRTNSQGESTGAGGVR